MVAQSLDSELSILLIFAFYCFLTPKTFCIRVQSINNIVTVSGKLRRDSAIHIHVSICPHTPIPPRLVRNIK